MHKETNYKENKNELYEKFTQIKDVKFDQSKSEVTSENNFNLWISNTHNLEMGSKKK